MNCDTCGTPIDYGGAVYKIDIQEWFLNRATGEKLTLCCECGGKLREFLKSPAGLPVCFGETLKEENA